MAQEVQATAEALPEEARSSGPSWVEPLRSLGPGRILAVGTVLLALLASAFFILRELLAPPYTLLFGGLESGDVAAIVDRLEAMEVPYRLNARGDGILVPEDEVPRLRMRLAEEGMPAGDIVGYELFDRTNGFTTTDFVANVNLKRALEGELARTIASIAAVRRARVHIVQPPRRLFQRERTPTTASVFLALGGGATLSRRQIAGIRHLVAAAVPGLEPDRVTVVDDRGRLLARGEEGEEQLDLAAAEDYRRSYEEHLRSKILELLERSLGPGRADAQVTAEMDFDELSTVQETFDPESQVARSTRTVEETSQSNQNDTTGAVTVANNLPAAKQAAGGTESREQTARTEETVNYEISRTVRNQRARGGRLRRLFVAVQVDGNWVEDANGTRRFEPLPEEELKQLEALVRSAAGIDEDRGDRIEIVSRPFASAEVAPPPEPGLLTRLLEEHGRLIETALWSLLGIALLLFGFRPLLARLVPAAPAPALPAPAGPGGRLVHHAGDTAVVVDERGTPRIVHGTTGTVVTVDEEGQPVLSRTGDGGGGQASGAAREAKASGAEEEPGHELVTLKQVEGKVRASLVSDVAAIIDKYPDEVVRVIRNWLYG